jgi:hypothetical protein
MIRAAAGLVALGLAACGARNGPSGTGGNDALLYVQSNVRDAEVYVDGRFIAPLVALRGGLVLEPGSHRLELRHPDYFSSYAELQLARVERRKLELPMSPILP